MIDDLLRFQQIIVDRTFPPDSGCCPAIPEKTAREIAEYRKQYGNSPENLAKFRYAMDYDKYKTALKHPDSADARQDIAKFKQHVSDFEQEIANASDFPVFSSLLLRSW